VVLASRRFPYFSGLLDSERAYRQPVDDDGESTIEIWQLRLGGDKGRRN
jgi:hypothetical protein